MFGLEKTRQTRLTRLPPTFDKRAERHRACRLQRHFVMMSGFVKSENLAATSDLGQKQEDSPDFTNPPIFERSDVAAFRSVDQLCIKAGVSRDQLAKLVAKELVDNALDAGAEASGALTPDGRGFIVRDNGLGIDPTKVPELFSVARRPQSTKYLRRPTRGAIGNGLRVVVGAVLASRGTLTVCTRGHRLELEPQAHDGTTRVVRDTPKSTAAAAPRSPSHSAWIIFPSNPACWPGRMPPSLSATRARTTSGAHRRGGTTPTLSSSCAMPPASCRCGRLSLCSTAARGAAPRGRSRQTSIDDPAEP